MGQTFKLFQDVPSFVGFLGGWKPEALKDVAGTVSQFAPIDYMGLDEAATASRQCDQAMASPHVSLAAISLIGP